MKINELANLLRQTSKKFENKCVLLPTEFVKVIQGNEVEESWSEISIGKVVYYLADMLEE
ncbi:MAG: hypothetical protein K0A89_10065 [ANME-2 cluster archaeon]|nr:hypothetical protein [ANME-2 cluster archaeon]